MLAQRLDSTAHDLGEAAIEIIAFEIGGQRFCVRTTAVREIRGWSKSTPLPQAPREIMGMMNLRGSIIPIVNMATKLGMPASEPDGRSAVIVAEVQDAVIGLLVDRVADILTVEAKTIQPTPEMRGSFTGGYVTGVIATGDGMTCFLDLNRMFAGFSFEEETAA
ncbi:chemotaxis protein CheW [Jiella sp. MQZ9-1]|uniref:Purine-binding chemotaxis protein CheW n=1 Tax=Jiella flava TaxID=2816857 RepID=A0A939G1S0_9HYPH|nr:chemotaxis protein CheW [Jiella flava]MBO0663449.1 purine-binding chemotaxis protein CheW [Jiella flava]MCD2472024.1 chemotaxis protein CheW [Jiella flava]